MCIGILVSARMGSTRLPNKHLLNMAGAPALSWLLARITSEFSNEISKGDIKVWVATGAVGLNEALEKVSNDAGVEIFYGDNNNIPLRHLQLAEKFSLNAILSVDGDDIFCSPEAMRFVYNALLKGSSLVRTIGLPLGMNAWGYDVATLRNAVFRSNIKVLETGWGRIFDSLPAVEKSFQTNATAQVRATLDYPDDLIFFDRCMREVSNWANITTHSFIEEILRRGLNHLNLSLSDSYAKSFNISISTEISQLETMKLDFSDRLHAVIPGGAHTYSRGDDQYPSNAPQILIGGKGCEVWGPDNRRLLDYGMALRSVSIGYSEPEINAAAIRGIELGNNLTRASLIELEAAELLVSMINSVDMVKFTKNGSTATSAAIKLARAYTGRDLVARCAQHPFFSFDDWFIGSTVMARGVPSSTVEQTKMFDFNDIESLEKLISEYSGRIACVILEPAALECPKIDDADIGCCGVYPCSRFPSESENYLQKVEKLCKKHGIVFILDEMITGFRWDIKGAQHHYGVTPDISTFGKAMANGFSVAALAGRREIMELGAVNRPGAERFFLLSTTHGAEMSSLAAFIATMEFMERNNVIDHLWNYGAQLMKMINNESAKNGIALNLYAAGPSVNPYIATVTDGGKPWLELRTLFVQEMIKNGVLMPWLAFSYRHGDAELVRTKNALAKSLNVCSLAIREGFEKYLVGNTIKPVFRKFN